MKIVREEKNKGITLIALIITVIILLILAGVSISLVVGDNGVLSQSQRASTKTAKESFLEEANMVLADVLTDEMTGTLNITGLPDEMLLARLEEVNNRMGDKIKKKTTGNATYEISDVKIGEISVLNNSETNPVVVPSNSTSSNGSKTLTVTVNQKTGNAIYYGLIQGAYYELELTNSKFGIKTGATAQTLEEVEGSNENQYVLSSVFTATTPGADIGKSEINNEIKLWGSGTENSGLGTGTLTLHLRNCSKCYSLR